MIVNQVLDELRYEFKRKEEEIDRLRSALIVVRRMIRGDNVEHAIVDMKEPDMSLGDYLDRLLNS